MWKFSRFFQVGWLDGSILIILHPNQTFSLCHHCVAFDFHHFTQGSHDAGGVRF